MMGINNGLYLPYTRFMAQRQAAAKAAKAELRACSEAKEEAEAAAANG